MAAPLEPNKRSHHSHFELASKLIMKESRVRKEESGSGNPGTRVTVFWPQGLVSAAYHSHAQIGGTMREKQGDRGKEREGAICNSLYWC